MAPDPHHPALNYIHRMEAEMRTDYIKAGVEQMAHEARPTWTLERAWDLEQQVRTDFDRWGKLINTIVDRIS